MKFFFKSVALVMNDQYRDAIPGEDPIVAKTRRRHRTILFSDIAKKICEYLEHVSKSLVHQD